MSLDPPPSDAELLRRLVEKGHRAQTKVTQVLLEHAKLEREKGYRDAPKMGVMNKTESLYAQQLELQLRAGVLGHVSEHGVISLQLAARTWYRPDFLVTRLIEQKASIHEVTEIHEVKGHWEDDARAKFKIAARLYPMFVFRAVRRVRGEFQIIETLND